MANPRQRRKARSSSHRPISISKKARRNLKKTPLVRGPKALQDAWDKRKTTKQNYTTLGLVHSLNPLTSAELNHEELSDSDPTADRIRKKVESRQAFGRIVRNDAGEVVRIELNEENDISVNEGRVSMDMGQLESSIDTRLLSTWATGRDIRSQGISQRTKGNIVEVLERISAPQTASNTLSFTISNIGHRHVSTGEATYIQRLVDKHGHDVEKMSRDRKLNPEQRTVGELRSALRRTGFIGPG